ncbi:hypothetical protein DFQ05_1519 [Winogradskyella wandonensis]|uniref:Uncharacterized protein n=1 Tax=Winogradskyella wandonensis TaxID=1442586 RepID=A0A4R1KRU3_9FLAO|nr:hypothetical protein [Winogradskyella wandonensis]TCK67738.1 hypothetical protein DFQ05_1519 [Winogradskyella wandonensis]
MKRNSINFIITIVLAIILSQFFPWWSVMLAGFSSALLIPLKKASVFVVPLLAIALFWIVYSWSLSSANDFILAKKIAVLLPLAGNEYLLLLVTGLIGGLAAGVSALFGKQLSLVLKSK